MSGSNDAIFAALISDHNEKSAKIFSTTSDSGFISAENLSENISTELYSENCSYENLSTEQTEDANSKEITMKVDSGLCCVSEDFSKLKLANPSINDLSSPNRETRSRISWEIQDRCKVFEQDEEGDTYLHAAIHQCYPEIALALIRGAPNSNYLNISNDDGSTALHLAVATDQWRIVRWLIVAGAEPGPRNFRGESPLHIAARLGNLNCCKAITETVHLEERKFLNLNYEITSYKQVDLDQWDYEGQTCIHVAALNGHIDVLRLLIWHGANVNAREGKSGYTALHLAVEKQNDRLAYFLLTECEKLDADATTYAGRSALQLGLPVNRGLMTVLLSKGVASPYSSEDESQEDSDEEMMYESSPIYIPHLVNGCA
ncbi:hypothetical protein HHI36_008544 [Cryptolaemus montrouzieri]|uniref:NF-kappa-B inhibitor cactus n=1 Tax=Cryptolaemus montrouzieri TaxID=559131 RepID=A0ABD2MST4_9CUCU